MKKSEKIIGILTVFIFCIGIFFVVLWWRTTKEMEKLIIEKEQSENEIVQLESEKMQWEQRESSKLRPWDKDDSELFYGKWEVTDTIYVDAMPVKDVYRTDEERQERGTDIQKDLREKSIILGNDTVSVNDGERMISDISYDIVVFPADLEYDLGFMTGLQDIGLNQDSGGSYAYVEMAQDGKSLYDFSFFVKDENTLIFYFGDDYYIEYARISE